MASKDTQVLIPGMSGFYFILHKGLCRYDEVNDLEVGRLFWTMLVGPACTVSVLIRTRQREIWFKRRGRQCGDGSRD